MCATSICGLPRISQGDAINRGVGSMLGVALFVGAKGRKRSDNLIIAIAGEDETAATGVNGSILPPVSFAMTLFLCKVSVRFLDVDRLSPFAATGSYGPNATSSSPQTSARVL